MRGLGSILAFLGGSISFSPSKFACLLSLSQGRFGSNLCFAGVVSKTLSHFHLADERVTILFGNFSITSHLGLLGLLNGESSLCSRGLCSCISHSQFSSVLFSFSGCLVSLSRLLVSFSGGSRCSCRD